VDNVTLRYGVNTSLVDLLTGTKFRINSTGCPKPLNAISTCLFQSRVKNENPDSFCDKLPNKQSGITIFSHTFYDLHPGCLYSVYARIYVEIDDRDDLESSEEFWEIGTS
jgi:hypothetical protein